MSITKKEAEKIFSSPIFWGVDCARALEIFTKNLCHAVNFLENDSIHTKNDASRYVGLVLSGEAVATTTDNAKNTLLRFLRPGDFFGIANLFGEQECVSSVRARKKCRIFFFTEEAVRELLEVDRAFLYNYLAFLSSRICYLNQKIRYLTAGSAERKLALYLCSFGRDTVEVDASLSSLSELLDIGRASLYRAFDTLIADGYIQKEGRTIKLLDIDALTEAYR